MPEVSIDQPLVKAGFWSELFTAPRIISFVVMLSGGAMWIQAFKSEVTQIRRDVETFKTDYQRSDTLRLELQAIRDEQRYMREEQARSRVQSEDLIKQVTALRRDLR